MATLESIFRELCGPGPDPDCLLRWPPDLFVFTSRALGTSDAYRAIVSPPTGRNWPPHEGWVESVQNAGSAWCAFLADEGAKTWVQQRSAGDYTAGLGVSIPVTELVSLWTRLRECWEIDLQSLCAELGQPLDELRWQGLLDLVALHAIADSACAPLFAAEVPRPEVPRTEVPRPVVPRPGGFADAAWARLHGGASLATFERSQGCVLPKTHTTQLGLTLRSLSHHLAFHRYATRVEWWRPYSEFTSASSWGAPSADAVAPRISVLLFPWPHQIHSGMFGPLDVGQPIVDGYGYFHFNPGASEDDLLRPALRSVIEAARRELGDDQVVDLLVMPETSMRDRDWDHLRTVLSEGETGFRSYVVGLRSLVPDQFGDNRAEVGFFLDSGDGGKRVVYLHQHKHHRWRLDEGQIRGYNLGARLDPKKLWWEGIRIPERKVTFVEPIPGITVCPLICEDLARQDPVASMLRTVGPSLVICLLMDGPQFASRWSSKYASVLADDPGSSVLTLTSKGMVDRWSSPYSPSREVVALWRDQKGMTQELDLCGSDALLLRLRREGGTEYTIDGRKAERQRLVLEGVTRLRARG